jgi:hypothetical protein
VGKEPPVRNPLPELTAAGSPVAALLALGAVPWYVHLVVGLSGPLAYAFRHYLAYRLSNKALDKVDGIGVCQLMTIITGTGGSSVSLSRDRGSGGARPQDGPSGPGAVKARKAK